jgi:hypothetical protein
VRIVGAVFSIEDVFALGIGFDIAGAYLVARGLLVPVPVMQRRATAFIGGNVMDFATQVRDRIDGEVGLWALFAGFVIQAAAYVTVAGGAEVSTGGLGHVVVAVTATVAPALVIALCVRLFRPRRLRQMCVEAARYPTEGGPRSELPFANRLMYFGKALGKPALEGESPEDYARRVWDVERIAYEHE